MTGASDEVVYPSQYETEVLLKDGSRMRLRPIKRGDVERWLAFISRLSDRTKYLRFHYVPRLGREDAVRYCGVDYRDAFAFVAEVLRERREDIIAIGRYYRLPNKTTAEVAFVIEDPYQGKGIGTKLMEWLANVARDNGITTFEASVLAENEEMMTVFRDYGFHIISHLEEGEYHVSFPIARTGRVVQLEEERERSSTLASLTPLLAPRSVAVIGASRQPGTIGQLIFECIMESGFSGVVYPVNPNAESVRSVKAYASVLDVPGDIDLAVVVVSARLVAGVVDECGRKKVRSVIVISDGFRESGGEGVVREAELRYIALGHGMRLVGPNCMGVINTHPAVSMNASFSPYYPKHGNIAFLSQSGAMGLAILDYVNNIEMGVSSFLSVGNRADVSSNDLLQYWEQDPATKVILLYLESFGNPRKFARLARQVSMSKPIVAVKSGSTAAGSRAAASHTGALATSEVASEALFRQAGIIKVDTMAGLFDVASLLSAQAAPKGRRVAILTNGGGPGVLAADACENSGLVLPQFSPETTSKMASIIKRVTSFNNPLDVTAGATQEEFSGVLKVLAKDDDFDAVIVITIPATTVPASVMENAIKQAAPAFKRSEKPLLACLMGRESASRKLATDHTTIPCYDFPEDAVSALAKAAKYGEWLRRPKGTIPRIRVRQRAAQKIVDSALTRTIERPLWLAPGEIEKLLDCYGIRVAGVAVAKTPEQAVAASRKLGFPVVVKLASDTISHKSDVGGVILDVRSEKEVRAAFKDIKDRLTKIGREKEMAGVTVQRMVKGGVETIVGVTQDPLFGPLIMFGLGGIYAELLKDVSIRLHPLTDLDAKELINSIKMAGLFRGFRGAPVSDTKSLEDLLLRISALVEDIPQIAEMDLNPVKVMPQGEGYWVVDARILLR
ncbi:MAG: GNAT family N-acetyltransferase [Dehalococcoidales bacterium]|nr:GNAT family N-acetyltransferase [Dehalococcoidales bacterium]